MPPSGIATCTCPDRNACGDSKNRVCGTDGLSYDNICQLTAAACERYHEVRVRHGGLCIRKLRSIKQVKLCTCFDGSYLLSIGGQMNGLCHWEQLFASSHYEAKRLHVGLFSNRWQKTSKCVENISNIFSRPLFLFLPHFDLICDLLLNRCSVTLTWNLFNILAAEFQYIEEVSQRDLIVVISPWWCVITHICEVFWACRIVLFGKKKTLHIYNRSLPGFGNKWKPPLCQGNLFNSGAFL